jgi:hypothetical protein
VREPDRIAGLPASGTTFVGRDAERAAVLAAVEEARMVTLLGPGGVGKTRLAAVVAEDAVALFPSGGGTRAPGCRAADCGGLLAASLRWDGWFCVVPAAGGPAYGRGIMAGECRRSGGF